MKRKIAVVTGSRAEYGLLYWLLREIQQSQRLELQLLVTGAHLAPSYGRTVDCIKADGFEVAAEVSSLVASDAPEGVAKSIALGVLGFTDTLQRLRPDMLLVMADRFEVFAAATAAVALGLPIAHLSGGESTEGAFDDQLRHAITKMSHLHFVTMETYGRRLQRMGETPSRVFVVGEPGLDHCRRTKLLRAEALSGAIGLDASKPFAVITYHPVTLELDRTDESIANILAALDAFPNLGKLFTYPGADPTSQIIAAAIERYAKTKPNAVVHKALGFERYLSALASASLMVGNSSSGIVEAPSFGLPAVNIGSRQRGRMRAANVIDVECRTADIVAGIRKALSESFRLSLSKMTNPYGDGDAAPRIVEILETIDLGSLRYKPFYDPGGCK